MRVTLTEQQMDMARRIGDERNAVHVAAGRGRVGVMPVAQAHALGAQAELAVAQALGLDWKNSMLGLGDWLTARSAGRLQDVASLEVRATPHANGRLLIRPKDDPWSAFVLVTAHTAPTFDLVGWALGVEAMQPQFWNVLPQRAGAPKCYAMPQSELRDMASLIRMLGR